MDIVIFFVSYAMLAVRYLLPLVPSLRRRGSNIRDSAPGADTLILELSGQVKIVFIGIQYFENIAEKLKY